MSNKSMHKQSVVVLGERREFGMLSGNASALCRSHPKSVGDDKYPIVSTIGDGGYGDFGLLLFSYEKVGNDDDQMSQLVLWAPLASKLHTDVRKLGCCHYDLLELAERSRI